MDIILIFKAFLALIFVIGLLFLTLFALKKCQNGQTIRFLNKKLSSQKRIHLLETHRLDLKNTLILFQKDNKEFLLLVSGNNSLLLETKETSTKDSHND